MPHGENGTTLATFLRARRSLTRPEDHGMPAGPRRTPGLRRDEVAVLAGISSDYYVRLEQGRERRPSAEVLEGLAAAFRLEGAATTYLQALAAPLVRVERPPHDTASPALLALMDAWAQTPALLYDRRMELQATNRLGRVLFSWLGDETNLLRAIFLRPQARTFYRDWERISEGCVAALRMDHPDTDDPDLRRLVDEVSARSEEFTRLWHLHEVRPKSSQVKHLRHPLVGDLSLRFENLTIPTAPGQHLVVYHAVPGSPGHAALTALADDG